jgi:hypothetical protein
LAPADLQRSKGAPDQTRARLTGANLATVAACREALTGEGSVGLIAADPEVAALLELLAGEGLEHVPLVDGFAGARLVVTPADGRPRAWSSTRSSSSSRSRSWPPNLPPATGHPVCGGSMWR